MDIKGLENQIGSKIAAFKNDNQRSFELKEIVNIFCFLTHAFF